MCVWQFIIFSRRKVSSLTNLLRDMQTFSNKMKFEWVSKVKVSVFSVRILIGFAVNISRLVSKNSIVTDSYSSVSDKIFKRVSRASVRVQPAHVRTHTHVHSIHGKWTEQSFFLYVCAMFGGCTARLVHVCTTVHSAQFLSVVASRVASLLRETALQVKKATEHREPLARFICGWTGGVRTWCRRYHRRVTDRHRRGVVRARRPSHVRQVGLTPCPGWTNWRSLGNVRQNLAHWRNSKASLWALLAWVAACHI